MSKMNFRLEIKSMSHWVDTLYGLWEKYLEELAIEGSQLFDDIILEILPSLRSSAKDFIVCYIDQLC